MKTERQKWDIPPENTGKKTNKGPVLLRNRKGMKLEERFVIEIP